MKKKNTSVTKKTTKKAIKKPLKKPVTKKKSPLITKDMIIGEVVCDHPELMGVFLEYGLHCVGCSIAQFDTIEAGARAHGIRPEYLLKDLNVRLAKKKRPAK